MSGMEVKYFLTQNTKKYHGHHNTIKRTQATLQPQYRILASKTLPKKHHPKPPTVISTVQNKEFVNNFDKKYKQFFLKWLQEAITKKTQSSWS